MSRSLGHVDPDITADEFFSQYVSKRQPVIIKGLPDDPSFQAQKWTDLDYLSSKAGKVPVLVEPMHASTQQFGTGAKRVKMPFRQFLASLQSEDGPYHYLTTQYSGEDWYDLTVFSPPTHALKDEFPEVPRLMGNLYLQQVNLWLGRSGNGSSSGLHHDFHDNLYCLLQGRKRFVLYPPEEHTHLYPHKTALTVYKNGVIAYDEVLRADGLDDRVALKAQVDALRRQLAEASGKGRSKALTKKERKRIEKELEEALDNVIQLSMDEEYGFALESSDEEDDQQSDNEDEAEGEDDTGSLAGDIDASHDDYDALMGDLEDSAVDGGEEDEHTQEEPASFSRIPTAYLHKHLNLPTTAVPPHGSSPEDFPDLTKATAPFVVDLAAGEMLYLPASWWHEVTSFSDSGMDESSKGKGKQKQKQKQQKQNGEDVHMAFNYWFYPPDAETFDEPYADKLVWEHLREKANRKKKGKVQAGLVGVKRRRDDEFADWNGSDVDGEEVEPSEKAKRRK